MITLILEKIGIKQPKKHSTHKPSVLWRITHDKAYDLIYGFSHQAITDIIKDLEQYLLCNLNNKHKSTPIGENLAEFIRLIRLSVKFVKGGGKTINTSKQTHKINKLYNFMLYLGLTFTFKV
jgi:hypothetical protein